MDYIIEVLQKELKKQQLKKEKLETKLYKNHFAEIIAINEKITEGNLTTEKISILLNKKIKLLKEAKLSIKNNGKWAEQEYEITKKIMKLSREIRLHEFRERRYGQ